VRVRRQEGTEWECPHAASDATAAQSTALRNHTNPTNLHRRTPTPPGVLRAFAKCKVLGLAMTQEAGINSGGGA